MTDIKLTGWCVDRELQVLCLMLREKGLPPVSGRFSLKEDVFIIEDKDVFMTEGNEASEVISTAIAEYFAPATNKQLLVKIRKERTPKLEDSDSIIIRHIGQERLVAAGLLVKTTLTEEKMQEWESYRQALRDFPATVDFDKFAWPQTPLQNISN